MVTCSCTSDVDAHGPKVCERQHSWAPTAWGCVPPQARAQADLEREAWLHQSDVAAGLRQWANRLRHQGDPPVPAAWIRACRAVLN